MATTKSASVRETSLNINQPLIKTSKYKRKNHQLCLFMTSVNMFLMCSNMCIHDPKEEHTDLRKLKESWSYLNLHVIQANHLRAVILQLIPKRWAFWPLSFLPSSLPLPPPPLSLSLSPKRRGARKEAGTCRCQTAYESWFFSSTIWVPETVLKSLPLMTSTFIHWAI